MNLHTNQELFQNAIVATAELFGIKEIFVEKDYWVTVALYSIFHSDLANQAVFKGGTALSKCYKLIDRFSEDIDLVILRKEGEADNQMKTKLRRISQEVAKVIPEINEDGITNKKGNIRKTAHNYDQLYVGDFGQIRNRIIVETTWLGNFEPFSQMVVSSYIYEMMQSKDQKELIAQYFMAPFGIQVLDKTRTFCEKIMSLVRFSRTASPIDDLKKKIRHIYDIHLMLLDKGVHEFFESHLFDDMLLKVGRDDMIGYKNNNEWILEHPSKALIFNDSQKVWVQLSTEYNERFTELVTGDLPSEENLVKTLRLVKSRMEKITWRIS